LPAGNDQLASLQWQPLPGAPGAQIYPLIRKIDTISSNSYLIQTPDAILLIDPGGLPEQAEQLMRVIVECRKEQERPVFVILTHAHIDHFVGIQNVPAFAFAEAVVMVVQEAGAASIERGDGRLTQADLLNSPISPMKVGIHLMAPDLTEPPGVPADICLANGGHLSITRYPPDTTQDLLDKVTIRFGPGPAIEIYHTPGHSPDGICIRIGRMFFIGDILFAASPGIAGLAGWSQASLVSSLSRAGTLLTRGDIDIVCPGHGRLITAPDAARMLAAVKKDALTLSNIAELNLDRAAQTAAYAEDCMEEVNELFTIMAGRLYYVSYVLDELGESEIAEEMSTLIHGDDIDELLEAFRLFADEHHKGEGVSIHLALKAGQVIGKLQRIFNTEALAQIIDPTLVHRAERLLSGYITMFRGFSPPKEITVVDPTAIIETLVAGLSISACSDDDVLSSADDEQAFAKILLARIGARPLLEDVDFSLQAMPEPVTVAIDRDQFTDLLTYVLEDLVGTGSDIIRISVDVQDPTVTISVTGRRSSSGDHESRKSGRFLSGLCERAGGNLSVSQDDTGSTYRIQVARAV